MVKLTAQVVGSESGSNYAFELRKYLITKKLNFQVL